MATPIYKIKDVGGILRAYENYLEIERKGFFAKVSHGFTKGDKVLYYRDITGIQIKKPGFTNGYIQFSLPGGSEGTEGIMEAMDDENSFVFQKKNYPTVLKIRELIEEKMNEGAAPEQSVSAADEIRKYKELWDEGIITEEQFNKKRDELFG